MITTSLFMRCLSIIFLLSLVSNLFNSATSCIQGSNPAATELEVIVLDWLGKRYNRRGGGGGGAFDTPLGYWRVQSGNTTTSPSDARSLLTLSYVSSCRLYNFAKIAIQSINPSFVGKPVYKEKKNQNILPWKTFGD